MDFKYKITVVGAGYVGMAIATFLSKNHKIKVLEKDINKIDLINNKISTVSDNLIQSNLEKNANNIEATGSQEEAIKGANYVILCLPTNFDERQNTFDTSILEETISYIVKAEKEALIVIKSTVPVGFTKKQIKINNSKNIVFSPEFLREGSSLEDILNPSRVIYGGEKYDNLINFSKIYGEQVTKKHVTLFMEPSEAEAVKLFSNSYLAQRVAFFNEIASFSLKNNISSHNIINGVSLDKRIGNFYNNPSFGFGGYCLPKDTKQLVSDAKGQYCNLSQSALESNEGRKHFIANELLKIKPKKLGIYRLTMKSNSDNFRNSVTIEIVNIILKSYEPEIIIYEPLISDVNVISSVIDSNKISLENNLKNFLEQSETIIANRTDDKILKAEEKIFSRELFQIN